MGGNPRHQRFHRKAMNSFVCSTEKPILFRGRMNDDVNTYVALGSIGELFFTDMELQLNQLATQSGSGGMTEANSNAGGYVKSFYAVMTAPSCITIGSMGRYFRRHHHKINWTKAVPKIIRQ